MKSLLVLFVMLFAAFLGSWTYKIKTPIERPDEYAEGYDPDAGAWWNAEAVEVDDTWRLDPEIPLNYVPVPGEEELYMVVDNNGNVIGYRQRTKQIDGSWKWETVNPDVPDSYVPVEGLTDVYMVTGEDGSTRYVKYVRNEDGTYAFVEVDENGRRIAEDRDATVIDGKHVHISGNLYSVLDDHGVAIGYDKRVDLGDGNFQWMEADLEGYGSFLDGGDLDLEGFENASGGTIQPTMDGSALEGAAAAMAEANAAANAGGGGSFTVNIDPGAFEAEYGNGYGDGYDDGYADGSKNGGGQLGGLGAAAGQDGVTLENPGQPTLPSFQFEGFDGNGNPTGDAAGTGQGGAQAQSPDWWDQSQFDQAASEAAGDGQAAGSDAYEQARAQAERDASEAAKDIEAQAGYHTETQVVKEKKNVNGVITTYETYVSKTYDDAGNLVSTKSDGPYAVTDDQRVSQNGVALQVMSGAQEQTLGGETARVSGYFNFLPDLENGIAAKLNAQRASNGTAALVVDEDMCRAARLRAADMAAHQSDGSTSYAYGTINSMLANFGVEFDAAAENTWKTLSSTADDVHTRFQAIEGSRTTRTDGQYVKYGVGAVEMDGTYYICETFAG